ncbi:hypothetical protein C0989_011380 [Termitomyces sp. Mn162]|nr:hypothetical protein C0989_011380 [Termitomyces sp. Mn162]
MPNERINEFNIEAVLRNVINTAYQVRQTIYDVLIYLQDIILLGASSSLLNPPHKIYFECRSSLKFYVTTDVSRFVTSLLPLPSALKENRSHRVLLAFNAACLHDFVSRSKALDEGTVAYLLPALLEPLQSTPPIKDAILGSYVLLAALSQKCRIAPAALSVVLNAMTNGAENILSQQYISAILSVCEPQDELEGFFEATLKAMLRIPFAQLL